VKIGESLVTRRQAGCCGFYRFPIRVPSQVDHLVALQQLAQDGDDRFVDRARAAAATGEQDYRFFAVKPKVCQSIRFGPFHQVLAQGITGHFNFLLPAEKPFRIAHTDRDLVRKTG